MLDYDKILPLLPHFNVNALVSIMAEVQDYNHKLMNIPAMWKRSRGDAVKVVILDTGVPKHVDLSPVGSKSFIPGYLADRNGHATHVGGSIAAIADNHMGVAGIAPYCLDYYGAVMGPDGSGSVNAIIKGIRWAVDTIGAQVINMSLGMPAGAPHFPELEKACNYAVDQGCTVVCAAGNAGGKVGQPACYDSVLAVAAVDQHERHAWFSNVGRQVDFAAGGVNIYSTWLHDGYAKLSGTSMAAPAIAGVAALIQGDNHEQYGKWLTAQEVREKLSKIAFDVGPKGFDDHFGYGIPVFKSVKHSAIPESVELPEVSLKQIIPELDSVMSKYYDTPAGRQALTAVRTYCDSKLTQYGEEQ